MSFGLIIILVVIFGYISNWLNWRYLNYKVNHLLYYVGAFVHESSHAIMCLITGAKIYEFKVFSSQPHVTHGDSEIPFLGKTLISSAPIFGGVFFLFIINHYVLKDYFVITTFTTNWENILIEPLRLISQMNLFGWQSWVMIFMLFNSGAMIGPSTQDIKNIWPMVILLFFVSSPLFIEISLIALSLIVVNIFIQITLILFIKLFSRISS